MEDQICPWQLESDSYINMSPFRTTMTAKQIDTNYASHKSQSLKKHHQRPKSSVTRVSSAHPSFSKEGQTLADHKRYDEIHRRLESEFTPLMVRRSMELPRRTVTQKQFKVVSSHQADKPKTGQCTIYSQYKSFSRPSKRKISGSQQIAILSKEDPKPRKEPKEQKEIFLNKKLITMIMAARGKKAQILFSPCQNLKPKKVGFVYYNQHLQGQAI